MRRIALAFVLLLAPIRTAAASPGASNAAIARGDLLSWDGSEIQCLTTGTIVPVPVVFSRGVRPLADRLVLVPSGSTVTSALLISAGLGDEWFETLHRDGAVLHELLTGRPLGVPLDVHGDLGNEKLWLRYSVADETEAFELVQRRITRNGGSCRIAVLRRAVAGRDSELPALLEGIMDFGALDYAAPPPPPPERWTAMQWAYFFLEVLSFFKP